MAGIKVTESGCWEWTKGRMSSGYGSIYVGKRDSKDVKDGAHRASYRIHNGDIPKGMVVCHACDNKSCVNPDHLFLGTQADNIQDAKNKGLLIRSESVREAQSRRMTASVSKQIANKVRAVAGKKRRQKAVLAGKPEDYVHCPSCDEWKPETGFYRRTNGGIRSECKQCANVRSKLDYERRCRSAA